MNVYMISDKDYKTEQFVKLNQLLHEYYEKRDFGIEEEEIGRDNLAFCIGCFGCWVKKPGECVMNDRISQINRKLMNSDVVIYLSPVIFGQFSANMKNVIDRGLPNMLPFFESRPDGSTMHPPRYDDYPKQIMIGYGEQLSPEDEQLFIDIINKHRTNVDALIYKEADSKLVASLNKISMKRVGGQL